MTSFTGPVDVDGVPLSGSGIPTTFGTTFYVDADDGNDQNDGLTMNTAKATVLAGYNLTTSGAHDIVVMTGNSAHTLTDELAVSKNRVHFWGLGGGSRYMGQRTRWEMGVTTGTAIAIVQVTGVGCTFTNIKFRSTDTLSTSLYAIADGGEFTQFTHCSFEKATDLDQTTAAELLANGDTAYYKNCSFGNNIYVVTVARQNILCTRETITGKVARDCIWEDCIFMGNTTSTTFVNVRATSNDLERVALFKNCTFWSAKTSTVAQALSFGIASDLTDAEILLQNSYSINITDVAASSRGVFTTAAVPSVEGTEAIEVT